MTLVYIGIGSNLGDRKANIRRAMGLLDGHPGVRVLRVSSLYETEPVDIDEKDPPMFLNGAAELETDLSVTGLLAVLKDIERSLGRDTGEGRKTVGEGYRSRPIDLDILLWGEEAIDEPGLEVPHPDMAGRSFVLEPLAELCPEREVPGMGRTVRDLLRALESEFP